MILPLLIAYEFGLLLTDFRAVNGVDFITLFLHSQFGIQGLLLFNLGLIGVFIVALGLLEKKERFQPALFIPVIAESVVYACFLGTLIVFIMKRGLLLHGGLCSGTGGGISLLYGNSAMQSAILSRIILSLGAGVNEELVFRLLLFSVFVYMAEDFFGRPKGEAIVAATLLSSLAFAAAHYMGEFGDPLDWYGFVYRFLAGVVFALLYKFRSLAVAVYTHAAYDIIVLVL
jgi:lysylphosphatidylglycerol synthetase-like protein (DUF2156 family)